MKLSRISEIDLTYAAFWMILMGGFLSAILVVMMKVEKKYKVGSGHPTQEPEHRFSTVIGFSYIQITLFKSLIC